MTRRVVDALDVGVTSDEARRGTAKAGTCHDVSQAAPSVEMRLDPGLHAGTFGQFVMAPTGPRIGVRPDLALRTGLTAVHELSHWIDIAILGQGSSVVATDPRAQDWLAAAVDSGRFKAWEAHRTGPCAHDLLSNGRTVGAYAAYLLRIREVWARSYAQWIALRTDDTLLLAEVAQRRIGGYAVQWDDQDFAPVADQLDLLFRKLRWA